MATKWKNKLTFFILLLLFTYSIHSIFNFINQGETYIGQDYFATNDFKYEFDQYLNYLTLYELYDLTEEEAINNITVTQSEIEEHRYRYGKLSEQIASIKNQYEKLIVEAEFANQQELVATYKKERDAKIEDITQNFASDEHVRQKIIKEKEAIITTFFQEKDRQFNQYAKYKDAFLYYLVNEETNIVYTNIPQASEANNKDIVNKNEMAYMKNYGKGQTPALDISLQSYHNILDQIETVYESPIGEKTIIIGNLPKEVRPIGTFTGTIAISKEAIQSNSYWSDYHQFVKQKEIFYIVTITGLILFIVSIIFLRKVQLDEMLAIDKWKHYYDKIPIDIRILVFLFSILLCYLILSSSYHLYYYSNLSSSISEFIMIIGSSSILILFIYVQGKLLFILAKNSKQFKETWKNSAVLRAYHLLRDLFLKIHIGVQTVLLLSIVFLFGALFTASFMDEGILIIFCFAALFFGLPVLFIVLRRVGQFNKLAIHIEQLANGNYQSQFSIKGKSILAQLAKNIDMLKEGLTTSQKVQAKSERLKTELITNVSHDLRTPLTSIITYTELLKSSNLTEDERNSYIGIIDRKSKRLKVLIDDLFEASKMASGNIELVKEKIDLVSLLQQALAEHDEVMKESSLDFRINHPAPPIYAVVDGQKLWRVFDNLISNILKYSLENTRVYISITTKEHSVMITFKNITKYELGENIDELIERFKRGDTSRNTEGSGLGLAIAKSIIDLHDGLFEIDVDGDLFKVTITLAVEDN